MSKHSKWAKIAACLVLPFCVGLTVGCGDTPKGATPPATFQDFPGDDSADGGGEGNRAPAKADRGEEEGGG